MTDDRIQVTEFLQIGNGNSEVGMEEGGLVAIPNGWDDAEARMRMGESRKQSAWGMVYSVKRPGVLRDR